MSEQKDEKHYNNLDKKKYIVRPIDIITAKCLIQKFHYSKGTSNTKVFTHGLFLKEKSFFDYNCLGVAWWLPPTKNAGLSVHENWQKVLSLSRLVIDPQVPKNGASFLLSKSINLIKKTDWECLLTYADSYLGHTGSIYRATNWEYIGKTKPSEIWINKKGIMQGRKRGPKNLSVEQMKNLGFEKKGNFYKHKYIMKIK